MGSKMADLDSVVDSQKETWHHMKLNRKGTERNNRDTCAYVHTYVNI